MDTTISQKVLRANGFKVKTTADGFVAQAKVILLVAVTSIEFTLTYSRNADQITLTGRREDGVSKTVDWPLAEYHEAALMAVETKHVAERS